MSNFTPGPWHPRLDCELPAITDDAGYPLAVFIVLRQPAFANVNLISAAPDMYAALKALVADTPCADRPINMTAAWLAAEDAIAKAEGRER